MTTKTNPKIEEYRNLQKYYETKWSKQWITTLNQMRTKFMNQQEVIDSFLSETELHGDENRSKKATFEKNHFSFLITLKVNKRNGSKIKSLTRLSYVLGKQLWSIAIGYMSHNNEKIDKHRQNEKSHKILRDNWVSAQKHKLLNKNN